MDIVLVRHLAIPPSVGARALGKERSLTVTARLARPEALGLGQHNKNAAGDRCGETGDWRLETGGWRPEAGGRRLEAGGRRV